MAIMPFMHSNEKCPPSTGYWNGWHCGELNSWRQMISKTAHSQHPVRLVNTTLTTVARTAVFGQTCCITSQAVNLKYGLEVSIQSCLTRPGDGMTLAVETISKRFPVRPGYCSKFCCGALPDRIGSIQLPKTSSVFRLTNYRCLKFC
jgi:hypothetical protein